MADRTKQIFHTVVHSDPTFDSDVNFWKPRNIFNGETLGKRNKVSCSLKHT